MCIGIPMQVLASEGTRAWCAAADQDGGTGEWLDMLLLGLQAPGTWVLAFQGAAREVMSEQAAAQATAARRALAAVLAGVGDIDRHFADLVGREPQLPEHLRRQAPATTETP